MNRIRRTWCMLVTALVGFAIIAQPLVVSAESVYFPHFRNNTGDVSGIVDVTKAPYNVNNHGTVDVSTVLQQVLDEHKGDYTIYFPNGTYLVSKTLQFMTCNNYCTGTTTKGPVLQGMRVKLI